MGKYIGFHGTSKDFCEEIIRTRYFKFSTGEEEWLGKGIYFFQDYIQHAVDWCIRVRKIPKWAVLKVEICSDKVIDLLDHTHLESLKTLENEIAGRYTKIKSGEKRKLINSVLLDTLYKLEPFDLVRAVFEVPHTGPIKRTNLRYFQIQLCVKQRDCIKSVEEARI